VTAEDEPKRLTDWELDQLRFSAEQRDIVDVASKDLLLLVDEVAEARRKRSQPWAPLALLAPVVGALAWLWSGDWRWFAAGLLALAAVAAVGSSLDNTTRRRR
jgi:hypothetical protein